MGGRTGDLSAHLTGVCAQGPSPIFLVVVVIEAALGVVLRSRVMLGQHWARLSFELS